MSESCNESSCSSCNVEGCSSRKAEDFSVPANAKSHIQHVIGIVSGIAPAHRQIHGDDRIVVVGIHRRLILHLYVVDAAGGLDIRALLHRRRVVPRPEIAGRQKQAKHGGSQQTGPLPPAACLLILHVLPILSQWRAASAV